MLTYLKCAWTNPFTRVGYLLLLISLFDLVLRHFVSAAIFGLFACVVLWTTNLGRGTVAGYLATRKRLSRKCGPSPFFIWNIMNATPCVQIGFQLAVKEYEREKKKKARR